MTRNKTKKENTIKIKELETIVGDALDTHKTVFKRLSEI